MRLLPLMLASFCAVVLPASAGSDRDADELISEARRIAAEKKQPVLVHFGASWSVWCRRLDAFMNDADAGPILRRHFALVGLTIQEHGDNRRFENPRGLDALKRYGGDLAGLPFFVMLDARTGGVLIDSKRPAPNGGTTNIGFPSNPDEITWFLTMVRTAAPAITETERQILAARLRDLVQK